jgi:uncharacterized membrane protein YdjX (TVP38/TMEM64 family)
MPRRLWLLLALALVLTALALVWQWLATDDALTPHRLRDALQWLGDWRDSPWATPLVAAIYVGASLAVFPLVILVAATGLIFGPWWGLLYAFVGTMLAAVVTFWIGRWLGRDTLMRHGGRRLNKLADAFSGRGIRTIVIVDLLPLAPFTLTNMAAGAFRIRFRDYLIGTVIGIAPGLVSVTLVGSQLGALATAEGIAGIAIATVIILAAVGLAAAARHYAARAKRTSRAENAGNKAS